jgi:hypothetical protein
MRAVTLTLLLGGTALTMAACQKGNQQPQDQNIVIDNNVPANADIEALPPDESSGTPANELANGVDNPDVNDSGGNSY